jgi:PKD repeat protein
LTIGLQRMIPVMAQTFTAGVNGQLDRISLAYDTSVFTSLLVSIESTTSSGTPSGVVLAGPFAWAGAVQCCKGFHDFAVNPILPITAGTKYAIVVQQVIGIFTWYSDATVNAYTGGQLYLGSTWITGCQWGCDFAFETWVVSGPVNTPPALAADSAAITVNEGTAPTDTGTYSDPDGDNVTLRASAGSITKTGTSTGTWSWTQPASDERPAQSVTITADDGHGFTATSSFTVQSLAVAPTAQIEPFTGAANSPAGADNTAGFTYSWTVTKNGNPYASGSGTTFSWAPDDEGTYVVTFTATDDGGMSGRDSMTVTGANVAPTAYIDSVTASAPLIVAPQEQISFQGRYSDPGLLDTHKATWDFGDGSSASGLFATHAYTAAGTYRVTLTVTDDDGGVGRATTTVTVQTVQQALSSLSAYVQTISTLDAGLKNSLIAKLNAASASAARGDTNAATNQLNAFLNEVQADQNAGKISAQNAATLRDAVRAIKAALGTYNRFIEWWPLAF